MTEIFLNILNMGISASWIVLAVFLIRLLFKKSPKWIIVSLWAIVAIRLICPFSFESIMSLIPSAETISPEIMNDSSVQINTGISFIDNDGIPIIDDYLHYEAPTDLSSIAAVIQKLMPVLSAVWIIGILSLLIYTAISYLHLKRKISTAVLLRDNIYQCETVVSPFVLGIIKPKIYLPFNISEQDMKQVVLHEQSHILRKDHLWKPLGFLLLSVHWFNPLMWLGYVLFCRDIELACDEKVVKDFDVKERADYSQALLTCSVNRRMVAACPLAFGEVSIKSRVKSVLNYKKPGFWIISAAIVVSIIVSVCFLTNPKTDKGNKEYYDSGYSLQVTSKAFNESSQQPIDTETYAFDIFVGTKDEFSNGTKFKITECNLQVGSLTVKLSGTPLYAFKEDKSEIIKKITVKQGSDAITLTDKNNERSFTFAFTENQTLNEAIAKAIIDENKPSYKNCDTECAAEGHIIYDIDISENKIYKVYLLTEFNNFGFENGYFIAKSGGRIPAVMTFERTTDGYNLLNTEYAQDGSLYVSSIKAMFPKKFQNRVIQTTSADNENLWNQCVAYAKAYLDKIGRNEEISNYSQVNRTLLTDVGVSVEVSNKILEYGLLYNDDLGYYEAIENGVRYIYRTSYYKEQNKIVFTKEIYKTKEIVEKIEFDSLTGDIISGDVSN